MRLILNTLFIYTFFVKIHILSLLSLILHLKIYLMFDKGSSFLRYFPMKAWITSFMFAILIKKIKKMFHIVFGNNLNFMVFFDILVKISISLQCICLYFTSQVILQLQGRHNFHFFLPLCFKLFILSPNIAISRLPTRILPRTGRQKP